MATIGATHWSHEASSDEASMVQNAIMPGRAQGDAPSGARSELAALRAEFNRIVKLHVDLLPANAGTGCRDSTGHRRPKRFAD